MGKKTRRKKNAANQSGVAGKGARQPAHAADHGPATYRLAEDKPVLAGTSGGFTGLDQAAPPDSWLPASSRNRPRNPDDYFVKLRPEDVGRPVNRGSIEAVSSGNRLPGWFEPHDPEPAPVLSLRPGDVLDMHARLAETLARPPVRLIELFDSLVSDTINKAGERGGDWEKVNVWAGMFWPAQSAVQWCGVLARQLKAARAYQITPPMVDLVRDVYEKTRGEPTLVTRGDIPWPAGFVWLDKANEFTDRFGNVIYNRAYSWDVVYLPGKNPGGEVANSKIPGIRVVSWSHPGDRDSYWTEAANELMTQFGGLSMGNTVVFPLDDPITVDTVSGLPAQDSAPRWLRCLWSVLESTVSSSAKAGHGEISHSVRRRALRSLDHAEVSVVVLRRAMTLPPEGDGDGYRNTRWTCRWFVDGFWRHGRRDAGWEAANENLDEKTGRPRRHHAIPDAAKQNCVTCGMPVSWVATYDKGPPGLPFKQRRVLHRLQR